MTNKTDYAPITYNCNGVTVDFPFEWKILEPESVVLILINEEEVETTLNYGEDYTVEFGEVGGNVKTKIAYSVGNSLVLRREASIYQDKSFSTSVGFQADEIEKAFDRNSINLQDIDYKIDEFKRQFSQQVNDKIDENKEDTDKQIEENKEDTDKQIEDFSDETNVKIQEIETKVDQANTISVAANTKADQALANSQDAIATSDIAQRVAQNAVEVSSIANANSTSAVNTANEAKGLATNAVNTANAANLTANEALTTANAASQKVDDFGQDIEKVIEAAEKIDELEGAVAEAKEAAAQATVAADNAVEAADNATQAAQAAIEALDSKQDKFEVGTGLALVDGVLSNTQTSANWGNVTGNIENQTDLIEKFNAVDDKIDELQTSKLPNATIIGTPHIEGSFVSGFSESNYLQFPFIDISQGLPFEIYFSFTTGANVTTQQNILDSYFGIALAIQNGKGVMALSSNGSSWDIGLATGTNTLTPNTTYYAKMAWTGAQYTTALSLDGQTYTPDMILNSSLSPHKTTIYIGASPNLFGAGTSHPFLGTINFNGAKVVVDGIGVVYDGYADIGFQTRANVSLSNLDEAGEAKIKTVAQEELNNPYSLGDSKYSPQELNNASWLASNGQWNSGTLYKTFYDTYVAKIGEAFGLGFIKLSTEEYNDYDLVINTTNETFRLPLLDGSEDLPSNKIIDLTLLGAKNYYDIPANGWVFINKKATATGQYIQLGVNSRYSQIQYSSSATQNVRLVDFYKYGESCFIDYTAAGELNQFKLLCATGNGTLYYYVGETVQNANLIDAGRITETLATKTDLATATKSSFPSDRYIDLTLGASGVEYIAPANGYFGMRSDTAGSTTTWIGSVSVYNSNGISIARTILSAYNYSNGGAFIPVKKGMKIRIDYQNTVNIYNLKFIYAEGEQ